MLEQIGGVQKLERHIADFAEELEDIFESNVLDSLSESSSYATWAAVD